MPIPFYLLSTIFLLLLSLSLTPYSATAYYHNAPQDLVLSLCLNSTYPAICIRTLYSCSSFGPNTELDIAQAAVRVSLRRAHTVWKYLKGLSKRHKTKSKRERVVLSDCVELISQAVFQLSATLKDFKHLKRKTFQLSATPKEFKRLRRKTFKSQIFHMKIWVDMALNDESTCVDGFEGIESKVKDDVTRKVTHLYRFTANALYMMYILGKSSSESLRMDSSHL